MALAITAADFRPTFYPGRSVAWQLLVSWASLIGIQDSATLTQRLLLRTRATAAMPTLPASRATQVSIGKGVGFLHEVLEHAAPDDHHWDLFDHGWQLAALDIPVSMVTGWYDIFITEQLRDFAELQQSGAEVRITVGPWWHGDRPSAGPILRDQVDWMVGQLLDDRTILSRPPVRIFLQQANCWLDFDRWPVPADCRDYHVDADGGLTTGTPAVEAIRAFSYDPADPTPIAGGAPLAGRGGQVDNRSVERRDDVLTYDTVVLTDDLDVIGEAAAEIFVRTEHRDADVFVRVCDVEPSGRSLNVTEGIRRLRASDQADDDLGTRRASVGLMPTAYRFRAEHRIRVQVSGGGFPIYLRNHQTGEPPADAVSTAVGRTQILHGPDHPTRIRLPIFRS